MGFYCFYLLVWMGTFSCSWRKSWQYIVYNYFILNMLNFLYITPAGFLLFGYWGTEAPNFQWIHSHFIGNNLLSQFIMSFLDLPRLHTCGRSACIDSFVLVIPLYTLHVLGWRFSNEIYYLLTKSSACIASIIYLFGYFFWFLLNVLL